VFGSFSSSATSAASNAASARLENAYNSVNSNKLNLPDHVLVLVHVVPQMSNISTTLTSLAQG